MTLNELLKSVGVADDIIGKIESGMKENKIYTSGEENLDIRYGKLKTQNESTQKQLDEANTLIAQLKDSAKGNEDLQSKISVYETQVQELQKQLAETKIKSAIKVALLGEKAVDVDYLTFKLESKLKDEGKSLELDDSDNIKGWKDMLSGLKTQFPTQFEGSGSSKKIEEHKLESGDDGSKITPEQFSKMKYADRLKLYNEDPEQYKELAKT